MKVKLSVLIAAALITFCIAAERAHADHTPRDDERSLIRLEGIFGYGPGFNYGHVGHAPRGELGAAYRGFRFGFALQSFMRGALFRGDIGELIVRPSFFIGGSLKLEHGLTLSFDALAGASRFRIRNGFLFLDEDDEAAHWLPHLGARARFTHTFAFTTPFTVMIGAEVAVYAALDRKTFDPQIDGAPSRTSAVGIYPGIVFAGTWRSVKQTTR